MFGRARQSIGLLALAQSSPGHLGSEPAHEYGRSLPAPASPPLITLPFKPPSQHSCLAVGKAPPEPGPSEGVPPGILLCDHPWNPTTPGSQRVSLSLTCCKCMVLERTRIPGPSYLFPLTSSGIPCHSLCSTSRQTDSSQGAENHPLRGRNVRLDNAAANSQAREGERTATYPSITTGKTCPACSHLGYTPDQLAPDQRVPAAKPAPRSGALHSPQRGPGGVLTQLTEHEL